MSKLYFKYGVMGSSKTAQALMCKFNYEQKGYHVTLLKPVIDTRDMDNGKAVVKSRIGLSCPCTTFDSSINLVDFAREHNIIAPNNVIIVDEAQFCSAKQVEQLHELSQCIPVLCYGLLTNFKTELFEGSKRLVEIAESLQEIKAVCKCGNKATVNARVLNGKLFTEGQEIMLGGDAVYESMCYSCYEKLKNNNKNKK